MSISEKFLTALTRVRGRTYLNGLYTTMHESGAFKGDSWRHHLPTLQQCIEDLEQKSILDFGCGPKGGLAAEFGECVTSYDPYVEKFNRLPWDKSFDVVFSSDVLEHLTVPLANEFLSNVHRIAPEFVFLNVSTRPAFKTLPNGANAHTLVKSADWWLDKIGQALVDHGPILANDDLIRREATFCFKRQ